MFLNKENVLFAKPSRWWPRRLGGNPSARQSIEIPDLKLRLLTLSSLLLGVRDVDEKIGNNLAPTQVQFSVDHRFARNSRLTFMVFHLQCNASWQIVSRSLHSSFSSATRSRS